MPASEFLRIMQNSNGKMFSGFQIYLIKAEPGTTISQVNDKMYVESLKSFTEKLPAKTKFNIVTGGGVPAFEVSHFSL
jgi:hypothetical protein